MASNRERDYTSEILEEAERVARGGPGSEVRNAGNEEDFARLPMPPSPDSEKSLLDVDAALYEAWREHMQRGFQNNQTMFEQVLNAFMNPYWTTVWMYRILFGVGVGSFVLAGVLAVMGRGDVTVGIFGGLSVAAFLAYFVNHPLRALEENLQFITWLGVIYNSYWTRMAYVTDLKSVQKELEEVTKDTVAQIDALMDKHAERSGNRTKL